MSGPTIGSLFSGIGGLERGLQMAGCGPVLWQCDSDPCARAVSAEHHPGVKIYEDVREIDATAQPVGLVCGGFPCQPHSLAGRRKGTADARWLWPEFQRVVAVLAPPLVFIENVPGLRTSGMRDVLAGLASLGFDAEWDCFSAAEVGARHIRRRLFILAYADREFLWEQPRRVCGARGPGEAVAQPDGGAGNVAYADGVTGQARRADDTVEGHSSSESWRPDRGCVGADVADAHGGGLKARGCDLWVGERNPAGRGDDVAHADGQGQLQQDGPIGTQWGWTRDCGCETHTWSAEPDVGRMAHGVPGRVDRLRLLGNAVVPQQAAHAFRVLAARAAEQRPVPPAAA